MPIKPRLSTLTKAEKMDVPVLNIPKQLPFLILDDQVLLPGSTMITTVTGVKNINLLDMCVYNGRVSHSPKNTTIVVNKHRVIGVVTREPGSEQDRNEPIDIATLHSIGTAAIVLKGINNGNRHQGNMSIYIHGLCRFKLENIVQESPYLVGNITQLDKLSSEEIEFAASNTAVLEQKENLSNELLKLLNALDIVSPKVHEILDKVHPQYFADICMSLISTSKIDKLKILDALDLVQRYSLTIPHVKELINSLGERGKPNDLPMQKKISWYYHPNHQPNVLDGPFEGNEDNEIAQLEEKLKAASLPEQVHKIATKELQRFQKMLPHMPEHAMLRSYLELLVDLPWNKCTPETINIAKARKDLDEDHYAMEKLKKRILEYLAVRQLRNTTKGPILCFVGPPGVGKTSLGRSIARSIGRTFHRISLGGISDQSDIRGHRRTYIGSMPGRIIQGLRTAGTKNPVFLLDELDKMSRGVHGDPAAAMLEVLDPEQNCNFVDHYVNVPFDLSQVMFIATANSTASVPAALLDRLEVIHVPGYTHAEKFHIAVRHLIPKQLREHGLTQETFSISDDIVKVIIAKYTKEAGVRNLERKIGALCRAAAVLVAERGEHCQSVPVTFDEMTLESILGPPRYDSIVAGRMGRPGIAIGLAWTQSGGDIMFVEATKMEGDGELILTGQIGKVMQESAKLALNWVRSQISKYDINLAKADIMENTDVHIHFPAGAVEKDGPSAGVTVATVLMSLFSQRSVRADVAMTGEITLQGTVLPVGGIKEKVLAAHRAGLKSVILPKNCEKDLLEVPEDVKNDIHFIFVGHTHDVLEAAFEGGFPLAKNLQSNL